MGISIITVNVAEWADWERDEVDMSTPYTVTAAPYGETITRDFAELEDATAYADEIAQSTGEYLTSWGMQPVNNLATITHYVDGDVQAHANLSACVDCAQYVSGITEHERGEAYPQAVLEAMRQYGAGDLVNGECDDCSAFHTSPCDICGTDMAGDRHTVASFAA